MMKKVFSLLILLAGVVGTSCSMDIERSDKELAGEVQEVQLVLNRLDVEFALMGDLIVENITLKGKLETLQALLDSKCKRISELEAFLKEIPVVLNGNGALGEKYGQGE